MTSQDRRGGEERSGRAYLGTLSTVVDVERLAIALALEAHTENPMLAILTDSQAAKSTTINLSNGQLPRSSIELSIKEALNRHRDNDTTISWARAHIGIPGNEKADPLALENSYIGQIAGTATTASEGGIRALFRAVRKDQRSHPGHGYRRTEWGRQALSAFTWCRTNRGPQRQWLHYIHKADDPSCPRCGSQTEDGTHIVFSCPTFNSGRARLGHISEWQDLDQRRWVQERDEEPWDAVEYFFYSIYLALK